MSKCWDIPISIVANLTLEFKTWGTPLLFWEYHSKANSWITVLNYSLKIYIFNFFYKIPRICFLTFICWDITMESYIVFVFVIVENMYVCENYTDRTLCEVLWWNHSQSVTKNLTPYRFNSAGWGLDGQNGEIHSFPSMYNTWGCFLVEFGWTNWFIQKSTLKLGFFLVTALDHLTSEAGGTHNFKGIANFHRCFEKFGTSSSKWAMAKASSFNIARTTGRHFFGRGVTKKCKKLIFFVKLLKNLSSGIFSSVGPCES